jgi:hypothetical protein
MKKVQKSLILDSYEENDLNNAHIVSLSIIDLDNLKLLKQYLPDLNKKEFNEQEKEAINKYNNFIESLKEKSKSTSLRLDLVLKKIDICSSEKVEQ